MSAILDDSASVVAIGLMSGTSMDGVDAAVIRTDGRSQVQVGAALTVPYRMGLREKLGALVMDRERQAGTAEAVGREITLAHVEAVERLLTATGIRRDSVRVLGFHGHTVFHDPANRVTRQIGDGSLLAQKTGIDVIGQFRTKDVESGGQGAPLVPLYHAARAARLEKPLAILNIGGVANVTWLPGKNASDEDVIVALDCGPGNALIDDFVLERTGKPFDAAGTLCLSGTPRQDIVAALLDHPYFAKEPPKSLDRNAFDASAVSALETADGAATLAEFTAQAAANSILKLGTPMRVLVCGGGRLNRGIMAALAKALPDVAVSPVEAVRWRGDALEAEAFGYLAVRSLKGLPLSLPSTTGVRQPTSGGVFYPASRRA